MYKVLSKADKSAITENKTLVTPVLTLSDGVGRAQVIKDDGCYVLLVRNAAGTYTKTSHWFPEAANALAWLLAWDY